MLSGYKSATMDIMFFRFMKIIIILAGGILALVFLAKKTAPHQMSQTNPPVAEVSRVATSTPDVSEPAKQTPRPVTRTLPKDSLTKPASQIISPPPQAEPLAKPEPKILNTDDLYAKYQPAVLNIWCTENEKATSGTATIIHPSGILITNAHIIKEMQDISNCVLRKANPFENIAKFEVLYVPNQGKLIEATSLIRNDFAFLKITKTFGRPEDAPWPFVPLSDAMPNEGDTLFTFGYGTEFVGFIISVKGIPLTFSSFKVSALATVDEDLSTVEALLLESGISAQSGSSGSPLVDFDKNIVALLSFVTQEKTTNKRTGAAILVSYINRIMKEETGMAIKDFLNAHGTPVTYATSTTP